MRVLLVAANRERIPDPIFPLGPAYVAAAVCNAGHTVAGADLCFGRHPLRNLYNRVTAFQPDIIGLSIRNVDNAAYPLTVDYLDLHREVVQAIRSVTSAPVVLGGSGFSILPQAYMEALGGDWGILGEAEESIVELLATLEWGGEPVEIPGLVSRNGQNDQHTIMPIPVQRCRIWGDGLRPDRDLFGYRRYVQRGGMGNVQSKRGCVFKCSYCTYPLLEGNRFRARKAGDVVDELEGLMRDYGTHSVFFVDSILNFPPGHVESICEEILRNGLRVRWNCYATPLKLSLEQAQLMARAGCEWIELGSDAVDDGQLARLGKPFDTDAVHQANEHCLRAGLRVCHTVIFGAPGETEASIRSTCKGLLAMKPTAVVAMTGIRIYPGTTLANQLLAEGRLLSEEIGLLPTFYLETSIADFLPGYLRQKAHKAGNWILPGLAPPLLPVNQRFFRALGISGPLWRLLRSPVMRAISRRKFRRPNIDWGVSNSRRKMI